MRGRAHQLKGEVRRRMFDAGGEATRSVADMVPLVDTLQRLGIDNHFCQEVDAALKRINSCESLDDGLQIVALRFRLLRQHGVWVPADVFDRFRDERTGSFSESLASDPRGLLSLYNAAHMATPGEQALDEAISFSRRHLASMNGRLPSPLEEQVSRALDIPLARLPKRLETCVVFHEEEYSRARMLFAKTFGLLSLMDDTYDVYATLEECHILNDAIQRWDETTASILPEYMKMFYINLVRNFQEFEHSLQPNEKYRVSYAKQAFKLSSKYTIWTRPNGDMATREAFQWAIGVPDLHGHRQWRGEEAVTAIAGMAEHAWKTINRSCMEMDSALLPAAQLVVNLTKTLEVIYLGGRDAYTFAADLKDLVVSLFLNGPTV
ncbi:unnamed protein product [Miscanthus lutarioriparius]|uniref:Uncharacterized protein n=1 Tax=Miscanthus lutarioriparius TaxID=422564 RepID=A0A811MFH4_9POAL|nr:unnamed protein product [Miscanthus lutarioriparius]